MNNAHTKSKAAAGKGISRRALARSLIRTGLAAVLGLAAFSSAWADQGRERRGGGWQDDGGRQSSAPPRQYEERRRDDDERAARQAEDQRRRMQEQQSQNHESRRSGRLTPDERRDLRRQINEAGADIYQRQRRR